MPDLANQRVRFATFHIERFTSPPRVVVEYYPMLTFDADGHIDLERQQQQLHTEVDRLEATDYAPAPMTTDPHESATSWHPDPITRRRLIAATIPSHAPRRSEATPHRGAHVERPGCSPTLPSPSRAMAPRSSRRSATTITPRLPSPSRPRQGDA